MILDLLRPCNRLLGSLLLLGCAAAPGPTPGRPAAAPAPAGGVDPAALRAALEEAAAGGAARQSLRLAVECLPDNRTARTLDAWGSGVGVLDRRLQIDLDDATITALVRTLLDADFGAFQARYGVREQDTSPPGTIRRQEGAQGTRLLCHVRVALAGLEKSSTQLNKGPLHPPLFELAAELMALCDPLAETGIAAAGLDDGLEKLGRGELAAETLLALLQERAESGGGDGIRMQLRGTRLEAQDYKREGGYGPPRVLELERSEVADLAARLAAPRPEGLPRNLWAEDYLDLTLSVLDQRLGVQARRFRGLEPDTHGERQRDFEALVEILRGLHARAMAEGAPAAQTG